MAAAAQSQPIWDSITEAFSAFVGFLPTFIGALATLVVGWALAGLVGRLLARALRAVGFDRVLSATGLGASMTKFGARWTGSVVLGTLTVWFLRLVTIQAAASVLALPELSRMIERFSLLLPNVFVAFLVLVAGALLGKFAGAAARNASAGMALRSPERIERGVAVSVFVFSVFVALSQLGIAPVVVHTLFIGFVGAVSLALGLAFGLGGRDAAADLTQAWLEQGHRIVTSESAPAAPGEGRAHH